MREVMEFIEREKLYGLGCGLVDMTLLASTLITPGAELWTLDKR
ncbi:PilT domain-containing protein, partial [mine drainage metagenome]